MEGWTSRSARCGVSVPTDRARALAQPVRRTSHRSDPLEDRVMKRLSSIGLKVAVVAAFVLTLAAPFRW
jgi:hypothetical protein